MEFYSSVLFICGIISIFAGFLVWITDKKNKLHQSWFGLSASICFFLIGLGGTMLTDNEETIVISGKLLYLGASFSLLFLFYFSNILTERLQRFKKLVYANSIAACSFAFLFLFTNLLIKGIEPPKPGIGWTFALSDWYPVFMIWAATLLIASLAVLANGLKNSSFDQLKKQQIIFVFWGTLISFSAATFNFLLDYGISLSPVHNLLIPFYFLFTGYAIVKNRLFDIKFIATELLIMSMGLVLVVFSFLMPSPLLKIASWIIFAVYCFIGYLLTKSSFKELQSKELLEKEVKKRTEQLQNAYDDIKMQKEELEKWYKLTIGREVRMAELKEEIGQLKTTEKNKS
jgi:hypothetical protein